MKRLQERLAPYATAPMLLAATLIFSAHVAVLRWFDTRIDALSGAAGKLGALLLIRAWPRQRWMLWLPLAFCALDLVEDALLLATLARFPAFSPPLGWLCSITTSAKLVALALSYTLMLAAVLRLAWAAWPGRHAPAADSTR